MSKREPSRFRRLMEPGTRTVPLHELPGFRVGDFQWRPRLDPGRAKLLVGNERNRSNRSGRELRALMKASVVPAAAIDLLLANLETHCVVGSPAAVAAQLGVVLWHVLGCDAGADDAAAEALANRLTRAGQQAPRRCRSRDRAGASFSPRISSQLDEQHQLRTGCGIGPPLPLRPGESGAELGHETLIARGGQVADRAAAP
jgi:hypothetical protein